MNVNTVGAGRVHRRRSVVVSSLSGHGSWAMHGGQVHEMSDNIATGPAIKNMKIAVVKQIFIAI